MVTMITGRLSRDRVYEISCVRFLLPHLGVELIPSLYLCSLLKAMPSDCFVAAMQLNLDEGPTLTIRTEAGIYDLQFISNDFLSHLETIPNSKSLPLPPPTPLQVLIHPSSFLFQCQSHVILSYLQRTTHRRITHHFLLCSPMYFLCVPKPSSHPQVI